MTRPLILRASLLLFVVFGSSLSSETKVSVGAAANLVYALEALHAEFRTAAPEILVTTTSSASGTLFAQLKNGAPFDVFLSADTDYPKQVVAAQLGDAATLRTFATGQLVF